MKKNIGRIGIETLLARKGIYSVQVFWEEILVQIKKRTMGKPFKKGGKFKNIYKHCKKGIYTKS